MASSQTVTLELPDDFVGQLLEGLTSLIEQWDATAEFLQFDADQPDLIIRECSGWQEARSIAAYYRGIVQKIEAQRATTT